ncbi:MAG: exodeoxyribonuclease III [Candidatus Hydrogenedentota bacterium]
MKLYSWNVNGLRAAARYGFLTWLEEEKPDVLCLQEIKAQPSDLTADILAPKGYSSVFHPAKKKGYSGTATYFKKKHEPIGVRTMGMSEFDDEGRVQVVEFKEFVVINAYWPNSQPERARLAYKLDFVKGMSDLCKRLVKSGKHVVTCGDYNIAHQEIDLARPKDNRDSPGFYPEECEAMNGFLASGFVDTFRHFCKDPGHYTWWTYRAGARQRNIGWRIDYHCVNREFVERVKSSHIHAHVMGSDHCPVSIAVR